RVASAEPATAPADFRTPPGRPWPRSTTWTSARSLTICWQYGPASMTSSFTRLLHLGNVVVDVVLSVPALPERGGDVLATPTQTAAGGGVHRVAAAGAGGGRPRRGG